MASSEDNKIFTEKLIKTIEKYKDDPTSTIARVVGKHCNREATNKSVGGYYLSLNIFHILILLNYYVSAMNFIELMTEYRSSSCSLMRLNNLIRSYAATIVNIKFCTLSKPVMGMSS